MGPPPESRFTAGAVTSETVMPPSSEATVSGPSMWLACTGPPPESRVTPPGSDTSETGRPPTPAGTVTVNPTLQPVSAQAGAASVSSRSDTAAVTVGAWPGPG